MVIGILILSMVPPSRGAIVTMLFACGSGYWIYLQQEGEAAAAKPGFALVVVAIVGAIGIVGISVLSRAIWLPPERVVINGNAQTAYVLNATDKEYVIFDPKNHIVSRVPSNKLRDRQYCSRDDVKPPLARLFLGETKLDKCP